MSGAFLNASRVVLEMLKGYNVNHVFGLPGETTLSLYREWHDFPEIKHVLARDERSAVFMADGYAKVSGKPGVCEGPSVGATHMLPGVAEAYKASIPMVVFTTDIPLHLEKRNMLTGIDQTALFRGVVKESLTVSDASEIPNIIRRAFRLATTGKSGPVHIRLPMDILDKEVEKPNLHVQKEYIRYPGHRPTAQKERIAEAVELLESAVNPIIICGQGVLFSGAYEEVRMLAEHYGIPVGTTISGKGSMSEIHSLSIGVIGARGGTTLSNRVVNEADLILYVGCNTDSASTDKWTTPRVSINPQIIHLDISEAEVGNNYPNVVPLIGDAKATLKKIIEESRTQSKKYLESSRIKRIAIESEKYKEYISDLSRSNEIPVHPLRFVSELTQSLPDDYTLVVDVGVSAIYTSTFFKIKKAGRRTLFNYAMGALGYALPAVIGVHYARPDGCAVALVGDGSFGFTTGELETVSRIGGNINVILFNNSSFGWIKAVASLSGGDEYAGFSTEFKEIDYVKIAEGYGIKASRVDTPEILKNTFQEAFNLDEPTFTEIRVLPENKLYPPVPGWKKKAEEQGLRHIK